MIEEQFMISYYKTNFQLINRLFIVHFIKRRRHYEVLLEYAGKQTVNRLGSRATQLPMPSPTNF
jgi:hypothetical protein